MTKFALTCCSTADLSAEYFTAHEIKWAPFHFTLDGKEYDDDLGQTIPFDEFYARIAAGAEPVTSQVNVAQYEALWEPLLATGQDIVHLSLSTGLSGSYNSACLAKESLAERFPDRKIFVVDSLGASSGYGLLVDAVCTLRDAGESAQTAAAWAEANKLRVHHWFFSTDLTSYYRGGRISKTAHIFGTMLGICPLLNMDHLGRLIPRDKYRGKKKVIEEIVARMVSHAEGGLSYSGKCFISQSACLKDAQEVAALIEKTFPKLDGPVLINSVGTTIGSHTGPGTVALFFFGDERKD